jgi:molybdate transport repressor ModE-like protein
MARPRLSVKSKVWLETRGSAGGGAELTPEARDLVRRFRRVKQQVNRAADRAFGRNF